MTVPVGPAVGLVPVTPALVGTAVQVVIQALVAVGINYAYNLHRSRS